MLAFSSFTGSARERTALEAPASSSSPAFRPDVGFSLVRYEHSAGVGTAREAETYLSYTKVFESVFRGLVRVLVSKGSRLLLLVLNCRRSH